MPIKQKITKQALLLKSRSWPVGGQCVRFAFFGPGLRRGASFERITKRWSTSPVKQNTVQSTVQYSTVQYSAVQYSTVQYSIVHYTTLHYTTVQYSTVQCSTVQYIARYLFSTAFLAKPLMTDGGPQLLQLENCLILRSTVIQLVPLKSLY